MNPVFKIFLGDSKTLFLKVDNDDCCGGGPIDLTSCTEINVSLPKADGSSLHFLLSEEDVSITLPKNLGKFSVPISEENSALLNVGELQSIDVTLTIAGEKFTVSFPKSFSVYEVH